MFVVKSSTDEGGSGKGTLGGVEVRIHSMRFVKVVGVVKKERIRHGEGRRAA